MPLSSLGGAPGEAEDGAEAGEEAGGDAGEVAWASGVIPLSSCAAGAGNWPPGAPPLGCAPVGYGNPPAAKTKAPAIAQRAQFRVLKRKTPPRLEPSPPKLRSRQVTSP